MLIKRQVLNFCLMIGWLETLTNFANARFLPQTREYENKEKEVLRSKRNAPSLGANGPELYTLPRPIQSVFNTPVTTTTTPPPSTTTLPTTATIQPKLHLMNDVEYDLRLRQLMEELVLGGQIHATQTTQINLQPQQTKAAIKLNNNHNTNLLPSFATTNQTNPPNQQNNSSPSLTNSVLDYVLLEFISKNQHNLTQFPFDNSNTNSSKPSLNSVQTLQQQLEFLQKNAEKFKKFQQVQERGKNSTTPAGPDSLWQMEEFQRNSLNATTNKLPLMALITNVTSTPEIKPKIKTNFEDNSKITQLNSVEASTLSNENVTKANNITQNNYSAPISLSEYLEKLNANVTKQKASNVLEKDLTLFGGSTSMDVKESQTELGLSVKSQTKPNTEPLDGNTSLNSELASSDKSRTKPNTEPFDGNTSWNPKESQTELGLSHKRNTEPNTERFEEPQIVEINSSMNANQTQIWRQNQTKLDLSDKGHTKPNTEPFEEPQIEETLFDGNTSMNAKESLMLRPNQTELDLNASSYIKPNAEPLEEPQVVEALFNENTSMNAKETQMLSPNQTELNLNASSYIKPNAERLKELQIEENAEHKNAMQSEGIKMTSLVNLKALENSNQNPSGYLRDVSSLNPAESLIALEPSASNTPETTLKPKATLTTMTSQTASAWDFQETEPLVTIELPNGNSMTTESLAYNVPINNSNTPKESLGNAAQEYLLSNKNEGMNQTSLQDTTGSSSVWEANTYSNHPQGVVSSITVEDSIDQTTTLPSITDPFHEIVEFTDFHTNSFTAIVTPQSVTDVFMDGTTTKPSNPTEEFEEKELKVTTEYLPKKNSSENVYATASALNLYDTSFHPSSKSSHLTEAIEAEEFDVESTTNAYQATTLPSESSASAVTSQTLIPIEEFGTLTLNEYEQKEIIYTTEYPPRESISEFNNSSIKSTNSPHQTEAIAAEELDIESSTNLNETQTTTLSSELKTIQVTEVSTDFYANSFMDDVTSQSLTSIEELESSTKNDFEQTELPFTTEYPRRHSSLEDVYETTVKMESNNRLDRPFIDATVTTEAEETTADANAYQTTALPSEAGNIEENVENHVFENNEFPTENTVETQSNITFVSDLDFNKTKETTESSLVNPTPTTIRTDLFDTTEWPTENAVETQSDMPSTTTEFWSNDTTEIIENKFEVFTEAPAQSSPDYTTNSETVLTIENRKLNSTQAMKSFEKEGIIPYHAESTTDSNTVPEESTTDSTNIGEITTDSTSTEEITFTAAITDGNSRNSANIEDLTADDTITEESVNNVSIREESTTNASMTKEITTDVASTEKSIPEFAIMEEVTIDAATTEEITPDTTIEAQSTYDTTATSVTEESIADSTITGEIRYDYTSTEETTSTTADENIHDSTITEEITTDGASTEELSSDDTITEEINSDAAFTEELTPESTITVERTPESTAAAEVSADDSIIEDSITDSAITGVISADYTTTEKIDSTYAITDENTRDSTITEETTTEAASTEETSPDNTITEEINTDAAATEEITPGAAIAVEKTTGYNITDEFTTDDSITKKSAIDSTVTGESTTDYTITEDIGSTTAIIYENTRDSTITADDSTEESINKDVSIGEKFTTNASITEEITSDSAIVEETPTSFSITAETTTDVNVLEDNNSAEAITEKIWTDGTSTEKISLENTVTAENTTVVSVTEENRDAITEAITTDIASIEEIYPDNNITEENPTDFNITEENNSDETITEEITADSAITEEIFSDNTITEEISAGLSITAETTTDVSVTEENNGDDAIIHEITTGRTEEISPDNNITEEIFTVLPTTTETTTGVSIKEESNSGETITEEITTDSASTEEISPEHTITEEIPTGLPHTAEITDVSITEANTPKDTITEKTTIGPATTKRIEDIKVEITTELIRDYNNSSSSNPNLDDAIAEEITTDSTSSEEISSENTITEENPTGDYIIAETTTDFSITEEKNSDDAITEEITTGDTKTDESSPNNNITEDIPTVLFTTEENWIYDAITEEIPTGLPRTTATTTDISITEANTSENTITEKITIDPATIKIIEDINGEINTELIRDYNNSSSSNPNTPALDNSVEFPITTEGLESIEVDAATIDSTHSLDSTGPTLSSLNLRIETNSIKEIKENSSLIAPGNIIANGGYTSSKTEKDNNFSNPPGDKQSSFGAGNSESQDIKENVLLKFTKVENYSSKNSQGNTFLNLEPAVEIPINQNEKPNLNHIADTPEASDALNNTEQILSFENHTKGPSTLNGSNTENKIPSLENEKNESDDDIRTVTEIVWLTQSTSIKKPAIIIDNVPYAANINRPLSKLTKDPAKLSNSVNILKPADNADNLSELITIIGNSLHKSQATIDKDMNTKKQHKTENNDKNYKRKVIGEEVTATVNCHTTTMGGDDMSTEDDDESLTEANDNSAVGENIQKWPAFINNQQNNDSLTKYGNVIMYQTANTGNTKDKHDAAGDEVHDDDEGNAATIKTNNESEADEVNVNEENKENTKTDNNDAGTTIQEHKDWQATQIEGGINEMSTTIENKWTDISNHKSNAITESSSATSPIFYKKLEMLNKNAKTNEGNSNSNKDDQIYEGLNSDRNNQSFPDMTLHIQQHQQQHLLANLYPKPTVYKTLMLSDQTKEEITATNWWHSLPYTEIRKFLNSIFDNVPTTTAAAAASDADVDFILNETLDGNTATAKPIAPGSITNNDNDRSNSNKVKTIKGRKSKREQWPTWILNNIWSMLL